MFHTEGENGVEKNLGSKKTGDGQKWDLHGFYERPRGVNQSWKDLFLLDLAFKDVKEVRRQQDLDS